MKYKALPLLPLAAALAACAGGGVAEPHVPVSIPTATPLPAGEVTLSSDNGNIENINTAGAGSASDAPSRSRRSLDAAPQNTSGISIRQREVEKDYFGYKSKETSFIFKTPGGAQYALSSYADPITVSYSSPDFKIPDRHAGQRLADGSRIFICCSDSGATSYAEITKQDYMKFGAWIGPNGEIDLFAGGFPVGKTPPPAFSYGSSTPETALSKGKITYQVWGIRVRNGQFVTSSYTPPKSGSYYGTLANTPVLSLSPPISTATHWQAKSSATAITGRMWIFKTQRLPVRPFPAMPRPAGKAANWKASFLASSPAPAAAKSA